MADNALPWHLILQYKYKDAVVDRRYEKLLLLVVVDEMESFEGVSSQSAK